MLVLNVAITLYVVKAARMVDKVNSDPYLPMPKWWCIVCWPAYLAGIADAKEYNKQIDKDLAELRVLIFSPEELELRGYGPDGSEATFRLVEAKKQLNESFGKGVESMLASGTIVKCDQCKKQMSNKHMFYYPESNKYLCKPAMCAKSHSRKCICGCNGR